MAAACVVGLCWVSVWAWLAARVWWVRERAVSWVERVERWWVRKVESVVRESEMRRSEAVSLEILKWDVHWAISWGEWAVSCGCSRGRGLAVVLGWFGWRGTYGRGVFVEEHGGGEFGCRGDIVRRMCGLVG